MSSTLLQRMAEEPCESYTGPMFGGSKTCMSEEQAADAHWKDLER